MEVDELGECLDAGDPTRFHFGTAKQLAVDLDGGQAARASPPSRLSALEVLAARDPTLSCQSFGQRFRANERKLRTRWKVAWSASCWSWALMLVREMTSMSLP